MKLVISTVSEDRSNLIGKNFKLDVNYLPDKVILTITDFTDINSLFPNFKKLSLTQQQDYMADRFQRVITNQGRKFITNNNAFAKFKQSIDVQIYSRFRNLSNKLPETEGLFESSIDNTEYTYTCTFKRVPENLKQTLRSVLLKVFDSLIFRLKINFQQKGEYQISTINDNVVGKLTDLTIHPNSQRQIGGWIDKWVMEGIFEHWPYKQWPDSDNDKIIEELVADENFVSVWKTKYEDLTNTHPELKGIFEKHCTTLIREETDEDDSVITFIFNIPQDDPDKIRAPDLSDHNREDVFSPMYDIVMTATNKNANGFIAWDFQKNIDFQDDKVIVRITDFLERTSVRLPFNKNMSLIEQQDSAAKTFKKLFIKQGRRYLGNGAAFNTFKQSIEVQIYSKVRNLIKKLPELKGIFESKSADDFGGDISDQNPYRLEVKVNIKNGGYLKLVKNVLENVKRFFELPVYGWPCNIVKDEDENLILNVMLADALTLKGAQNHQQVVKRVVTMRFEKEGLFEYFDEDKDIKYKIVETTFDKMTAKLPELKGVFESRLDKDKRVLYVKFDPIADSAVAELLETILNKTSRYFNFWFDDQPSSVNKNGTCFTFVLDCSNIVKADTTESGEAFFWNNYRATQEEIYRNTKIPSEVRQEYGKLVHWNFEWASKYKEMVTKLPELEGIFESEYSSLFEKYLS